MSDLFSKLDRSVFLLFGFYVLIYCCVDEGFILKLNHNWFQFLVSSFANLFEGDSKVMYVETGSGDTLFHWYRSLLVFLIAFLLTILTLSFYKKKQIHKYGLGLITALIRYYLFYYLFVYGIAKIFNLHFPDLDTFYLKEEFGECSPMGLLWRFMGYSHSYEFFTGVLELTVAILLVFRRTLILGILASIGVMSNVLMLNLSFDVPAKLFAGHLLGFSLFLLFIERKRIYNFFFLNKLSDSVILSKALIAENHPWRLKLKFILLIVLIGGSINELYNDFQYAQELIEQTKLVGSYTVQKNDNSNPDSSNQAKWETLYFSEYGFLKITLSDKRFSYKRFTIDTSLSRIFVESQSETLLDTLYYELSNDLELELYGYLESDSISFNLTKLDLKDFPLMKRGFNWIQETPHNK